MRSGAKNVSLEKYRKKRDFKSTPEPESRVEKEGKNGAGDVFIWDQGNYHALEESETDLQKNSKKLTEGLEKGHITFILKGKKLKGEFALVMLKRGAVKKNWLLIKKD